MQGFLLPRLTAGHAVSCVQGDRLTCPQHGFPLSRTPPPGRLDGLFCYKVQPLIRLLPPPCQSSCVACGHCRLPCIRIGTLSCQEGQSGMLVELRVGGQPSIVGSKQAGRECLSGMACWHATLLAREGDKHPMLGVAEQPIEPWPSEPRRMALLKPY